MHATVGADGAARFKREAAERAAELVQSGMVVGLGTGSTAIFATQRIAAKLGDGSLRDVVGVATSTATEAEARRLGIPLAADDLPGTIDLTIDGADEVDPRLDLIKGGGGALLREKIVATISQREVIVVDESKLSPVLGTHWALPVEVVPFGWRAQLSFLESLGARVTRRTAADGLPYHSDQGNFIIDAEFGPIVDAAGLAAQLAARPGIVEHGLFLGLATDCFVAGPAGVRHITRR